MPRRVVTGLAVGGALLAAVQPLTLTAATTAASAPSAASADDENAITGAYYKALLLNTSFTESTYDESIGSYPLTNSGNWSVLGNAVLLEFGTYDAGTAGVPKATLLDHTLDTIRYAAAHNRNVDPNASPIWGKRIYFDTTGESYFVAAAKLLWDDLDDTTRKNIDTIIRGSADYTADLGTDDDPLSPGWTTNGLKGGFASDTKMEEMGARTMPLATALAWLPDDPRAAEWREWLTRWNTNMSGLPAADLANPTEVEGTPISEWNQAQNEYDSFLVENHGSWAPIYQQSIGAYPGRNIIHFILADQKAPAGLTTVPNDDALWATMARNGTDAGVPEDFMVPDRHHLYGRNILPITYRAVAARDPYAARAEHMLADHLIPYVDFAPSGRLTKFSGQPSYEPEARAELGMAYLMHHFRDRVGGGIAPVSQQEYFDHFSSVADYGDAPGLTVQQSPKALAGAVTKPGFTKFAYLPQHDDWLFDVAGPSPSMLPSVNTALQGHTTHAYHKARDGIDATATTVRTASGAAGFTTLPDGSVVYASSGLAAGEGALRLHNMDMPGVPGLDGDRTFSWAGDFATLTTPRGLADGGLDEVSFPATNARYVRMQGDKAATGFGFSLFEFEVYGDQGGPNLALSKPTTASSFDSGNQAAGGPFPPELATDGKTTTRWAVAPSQRTDPGWIDVDLGSAQRIGKVTLRWESAFASQYRIQVSDDGENWRTVSEVPRTVRPDSDWLNVDGRAGFVVRGGSNPLALTPTAVTLSDGPASGSAGMVIEGHPAQTPAETARQAAAPAPSDLPQGLAASLAGGQLSVFNLGAQAVDSAEFTVPQQGPGLVAYQGTQTVASPRATRYTVAMDAADAEVAAARFTVSATGGGTVPNGTVIEVADSHTVRLTAPAGRSADLKVVSSATGESKTAQPAAGAGTTVRFHDGPLVPTADLARGRTTFPTSPLPEGMTSPAGAVDGAQDTAWQPGPGGRMVVDLGTVKDLGSAALTWSKDKAPGVRIEVSADGVSYRQAGTAGPGGQTQAVPLPGTGRYVAVRVPDWRTGQPSLADLAVLPPGAG